MSPKKIIFLVIAGILLLSLMIGISYVSNRKPSVSGVPKSIKIWINRGTTDDYTALIEGFKKYAPEYSKTNFVVEKQNADPDRYRLMILNTLSDNSGPDILMIQHGEDAILEDKVDPIPDTVLDFSKFDTQYDDVFHDLIDRVGSGKDKKTYLKGVPLGYETLGMFYNKSIVREVPKTWNDLDRLTQEINEPGKYVTNLGLGPVFVPNMIDILPIWFSENNTSYTGIVDDKEGISMYMSFSKDHIKTDSESTDTNANPTTKNISEEKDAMLREKYTTFDKFLQGNIGILFGYPSLIMELELSSKRVNSSINNMILSERIPQESLQEKKNIARYSYFGISKSSKNSLASVKFLEYLMTEDAERIYLEKYPYLIPAQISFYTSSEKNILSENFQRVKLNSFIPEAGEKLRTYNYGIKSHFEKYIHDTLDTTGNGDIEIMVQKIYKNISCDLQSTNIEGVNNENCRE